MFSKNGVVSIKDGGFILYIYQSVMIKASVIGLLGLVISPDPRHTFIGYDKLDVTSDSLSTAACCP